MHMSLCERLTSTEAIIYPTITPRGTEAYVEQVSDRE
jgi:hypothetical protein